MTTQVEIMRPLTSFSAQLGDSVVTLSGGPSCPPPVALIQFVFLNKTSYFARPIIAVTRGDSPAGATSQLRPGV